MGCSMQIFVEKRYVLMCLVDDLIKEIIIEIIKKK